MHPLALGPTGSEVHWFQRKVMRWGADNFVDLPWRSCDSPIHQLIAEILLQRTRAEQVVPVFNLLTEKYPDARSLSLIDLDDLRSILKPLGLRWRVALLHQLIQVLNRDYKGLPPDDTNALVALPAVGPYAASAYLSLHRNRRLPIIDTNVVRVYGRFFGFEYDAETRRQKWLAELAGELTPKRAFRAYNYALLDFARAICKAKPRCGECFLRRECMYVNG